MGLLGSLKKATGIGLSARERYARAFEKAVLLGPGSFGKAAELFEDAKTKAVEEGDTALADRAIANARLYEFLSSRRVSGLGELHDVLGRLTEIERIGLQSETMEPGPLLAEIEARLAEATIEGIAPEHHQERAVAHSKASDRFKSFFSAPLLTYRFHAVDAFVETAQQRYFLHQGLASRHLALASCNVNPDQAAEHMARALGAFRQCGDEERARTSEEWLSRIRQRRSCWLCHREFQGAGLHFESYGASVAPYAVEVVSKLGQDTSSLDSSGGSIVVCRPCGSMVERQADLFARRRTEELERAVAHQIAALQGSIASLEARIATLSLNRR